MHFDNTILELNWQAYTKKQLFLTIFAGATHKLRFPFFFNQKWILLLV